MKPRPRKPRDSDPGPPPDIRRDIIRIHYGKKRYGYAKDAPDLALGGCRIGGPIVDLPPGIDYPQAGYVFVAQLDLGRLAEYDLPGLLPKEGFLIFFMKPGYPEFEDYVVHSTVARSDLRRVVREHEDWFYEGAAISGYSKEVEDIAERYDEDGWSCFAGSERSKVYGIYTHVQKSEDEIIRVTEEGVVLLQVGEDLTGEGVLSVLIKRDQLEAGSFGRCQIEWGQT